MLFQFMGTDTLGSFSGFQRCYAGSVKVRSTGTCMEPFSCTWFLKAGKIVLWPATVSDTHQLRQTLVHHRFQGFIKKGEGVNMYLICLIKCLLIQNCYTMSSRWESITKFFKIINMVYELAIKTNLNVDIPKWREEIKIITIS